MNYSPLLKDIRQLGQWKAHDKTDDQLEYCKRDILQRITSLAFPHEVWDVLITHNGVPQNRTIH